MPIAPALLELSESDPNENNCNKFGEVNIETRYLSRCAVCLKDIIFNELYMIDLAAKMLAQFRFHIEKD